MFQVRGAPLLWTNWANDWLSGKDRTLEAEKRAYACACAYARARACADACNRASACAYACEFTSQEQILTFLQNLK